MLHLLCYTVTLAHCFDLKKPTPLQRLCVLLKEAERQTQQKRDMLLIAKHSSGRAHFCAAK